MQRNSLTRRDFRRKATELLVFIRFTQGSALAYILAAES
jgi:hypothetical protein